MKKLFKIAAKRLGQIFQTDDIKQRLVPSLLFALVPAVTFAIAPAPLMRLLHEQPALIMLLVTSLSCAGLAFWIEHRNHGQIVKQQSLLSFLKDRAEEQSLLLDLYPDAIFTMSSEGTVNLFNTTAARWFHWNPDAERLRDAWGTLGKHTEIHPETIIRELQMRGEWEVQVDLVLSATAGKVEETKHLSCRFHWVRHSESKAPVILVIAQDITEKKASELQRLRSERLQSIGTLASGIAHDVNNALLPIVFSAELLRRNPNDPKNLQFIDHIVQNTDRVKSIVKQILLFVGGNDVGKQTFDAAKLLGNTDQILQHTLPKTINVKMVFPNGLWSIAGDETQISQVLMNLCINARDAMGDKGILSITAENTSVDEMQAAQHHRAAPGPHVKVTVTDTGSGIPPEILDKVFDPFFTTKEAGRGTGLGLSTVLGIVESHRGFLKVSSQVGQGTRFEIWLPATPTDFQEKTSQDATAPRGTGQLLLVVDDEEDICAIAKEALQDSGYRVLTAGDGTEAIAVFAQNRHEIAAVLCDLMMPIMDGPATMRAIKRLEPDVPIIAMSGLMEERAESAKMAGATAVLEKPFSANSLLQVVADWVLDRKKAA